jgi:pyruvate dehydrogenase kinase 2/3/4
LSRIRRYPEIKTLDENKDFCRFLRDLLDEHAAAVPNLSLGLSLSSPYLTAEHLDSFMRRMLVSRLSRRVLAEHHVALSEAVNGQQRHEREHGHIGIISTALDVKGCVEKCSRWLRQRPLADEEDLQGSALKASSAWPEVVVDGHLDARFSYIREHLEYVQL